MAAVTGGTGVSRRRFLGRSAAAAAGLALLAAAGPRVAGATTSTTAAFECTDELVRDLRPYKGFGDVYEGSGGQCTTYAARRFDMLAPLPGHNWRGGARLWVDHAAAQGWAVRRELGAARRGALVVWDNWDGASAPARFNGHVAVIEHVNDDGVEISEMNWGNSCWDRPRDETSMLGRLSFEALTWKQLAQRGPHAFAGYVYPERALG